MPYPGRFFADLLAGAFDRTRPKPAAAAFSVPLPRRTGAGLDAAPAHMSPAIA